MTGTAALQSDEVSDPSPDPGSGSGPGQEVAEPRRGPNPWVVFAVGFGALYSLLLFNSRSLFTTVVTEGGDSGRQLDHHPPG